MPKINEKTYVDDGVYAWFDGYQMWITLDQGKEITPDEVGSIALDDHVLNGLTKLREFFNQQQREREVEGIQDEDLQAAAEMFDKICGEPI